MQSGFICWRDINGVAKVRSMCDPRGVADVVDESALKWVSEEKFAQYGAQHALLTPIATSKILGFGVPYLNTFFLKEPL